mgnify:CR=1 FL=1
MRPILSGSMRMPLRGVRTAFLELDVDVGAEVPVQCDGESLLAFGLRGNLFRTDDGGQTWARLDSGTTLMLTSAARAG